MTLEAIARDKAAARERAEAARRWAMMTYSPAAHVDSSLARLRPALAVAPYARAGRVIGRTRCEMGIAWGDSMALRLAQTGSDRLCVPARTLISVR